MAKLGDLASWRKMERKLSGEEESDIASENELAWIDDAVGSIQFFDELEDNLDLDVRLDKVAISGLQLSELDTWALSNSGVEVDWILGICWTSTLVVAMRPPVFDLYVKTGEPVSVGEFFSRVNFEDFSTGTRDAMWNLVASSKFVVGSQRALVINNCYYLLLMPIDFVNSMGFIDAEDQGLGSMKYGWTPNLRKEVDYKVRFLNTRPIM